MVLSLILCVKQQHTKTQQQQQSPLPPKKKKDCKYMKFILLFFFFFLHLFQLILQELGVDKCNMTVGFAFTPLPYPSCSYKSVLVSAMLSLFPPKGGRGCLMSPPCLESQGCHLIPLCYFLSCSSA